MNLTWIHIAWTLMICAAFVAIVLWAWSGKRKHAFDAAAHIPLENDESSVHGGRDHG